MKDRYFIIRLKIKNQKTMGCLLKMENKKSGYLLSLILSFNFSDLL